MADHPLRPATDRRLGAPLPHQLANPTRADPSAVNLSPPSKARNWHLMILTFERGAYPVLARVSPGYPEPKGTFPRVTHPSATDVLLRPFDLHVLSLPPAFVLSQDQTLRLNETSNLGFSGHAIDEVSPVGTKPPDPEGSKSQAPTSCEFSEKRDRRSLFIGTRPPYGNPQRPHGASPSTLLFLQTKLSKSRKPNPAKHPLRGTRRKTLPTRRGQETARPIDHPIDHLSAATR